MKKWTALVFLIITVFAFTSCKKAPKTPPEQIVQEPPPSLTEPEWEDAGETLIDWIRAGTYTYTYVADMNVYGMTMIQEATIAVDGENMAINSSNKLPSVSLDSMGLHAILKGNTLYILNNTKKTYFQKASEEETLGDITDFDNMQYIGVGVELINGEMLQYREYNITGGTSRFYMDGSEVRAIDVQTKEVKMLQLITDASNEIPPGVFDIPEDYVESEDVFNLNDIEFNNNRDYNFESLMGL